MPTMRDDYEDDDHAEDLADRDDPLPEDQDPHDEPDLAICPHCRKMVNEDAERCHHCGQYILEADRPSHVPLWFWIGLVAAMVVMLLWLL
jgi:hypothetical protein